MTDFLEELLNQKAEEEEEQAQLRSTLRSAHAAPLHNDLSRGRFPDGKWAEKELVEIPKTTALALQNVSVKQRAAAAYSRSPEPGPANHHSAAFNMPKETDSPVLSLWDRAKRTYSAARLWQARTVRSAGSIFGTAGQVASQPYNLDKQEMITPGYAALVDAAFARDARRYDGPLRIL